MAELFEPDYGEDNSPSDTTQITTTLLYYSEEQLAEFKKLGKFLLREELGIEQAKEKGNLSDLVLTIMRKEYANIQAKKSDN